VNYEASIRKQILSHNLPEWLKGLICLKVVLWEEMGNNKLLPVRKACYHKKIKK
jgi:hypothetical protein